MSIIITGDSTIDLSPQLKEQYAKAENLLRTHMKELNSLAQYLYQYETITGDEFMDVLKDSLNPTESQI